MSTKGNKQFFGRRNRQKLPPLIQLTDHLPNRIPANNLEIQPEYLKSFENVCSHHDTDLKDMETNTEIRNFNYSFKAKPKIIFKTLARLKNSRVSKYKHLTPVTFSPNFLSKQKVPSRVKSQGHLKKSVNSPLLAEFSPARKSELLIKKFLLLKILKV